MANWLLAGFIAAMSADAGTTHYGLAKYGCCEVVLPTQNPWVVDGIEAGEITAGIWAFKRLYKHNRKMAVILLVGATIAHSAATVNNVYQLQHVVR